MLIELLEVVCGVYLRIKYTENCTIIKEFVLVNKCLTDGFSVLNKTFTHIDIKHDLILAVKHTIYVYCQKLKKIFTSFKNGWKCKAVASFSSLFQVQIDFIFTDNIHTCI